MEKRDPDKATQTPERLISLDAFRGLTILAMILVNNPGSWSHIYAPFQHADWHGWTPTDLIFPFFLYIVGTSLSFSLRKYRHAEQIERAVYWRILRRTAVLMLLGLLLGLSGQLASFLFGQNETIDLATLRLPGVLQRIALVYLISSLMVIHVGLRGQIVLATVLLLGYWALLAWLPNRHDYQANLSPEGNVVRVVDRRVLGESHMYTQSSREKTDPEGLLSTLPAIVTTLLGYWTGLLIQSREKNMATVLMLFGAGIAGTALGLGWDLVLPINKKIWTSSYVLLSGGLATISLAICLGIFDIMGWRRLARPFELVGINAIFVFVASGVVARLISILHVGDLTVKAWLIENLFTNHIGNPQLASLAYAVATVGFWWLVLWAMAKKGWTIRV